MIAYLRRRSLQEKLLNSMLNHIEFTAFKCLVFQWQFIRSDCQKKCKYCNSNASVKSLHIKLLGCRVLWSSAPSPKRMKRSISTSKKCAQRESASKKSNRIATNSISLSKKRLKCVYLRSMKITFAQL